MNAKFFARSLSVLVFAAAAALGQGGRTAPPRDAFLDDLTTLAALPNRLPGSPEGAAVARYIEQRLTDAHCGRPLEISFPVWRLETVRCQLSVNGVTVDVYPMHPDALVPPATPAEGLSGPLIYAGGGELSEYGSRSPQDAIVVLEYGVWDNWKRAFAMGARAVVFVGGPASVASGAMHVGGPADLVRAYVPDTVLAHVNLRRDWPTARLVSHVRWVRSTGADIVAYLPGGAPTVSAERARPEMVVLSAAYDSYGEVPDLANGARGAANVAALLDAARYFQEHRPARNLLLAFFDDHAFYREGSRRFYAGLCAKQTEFDVGKEAVDSELAFRRRMAEVVAQVGAAGVSGPRALRSAVMQLLQKEAEFARTDENLRLTRLRLTFAGAKAPEQSLVDEKTRLTQVVQRWDDARRALESGKFAHVSTVELEVLRAQAQGVVQRRIAELALDSSRLVEEEALRRLCDSAWIALHVNFDLSDGTVSWAPIMGDNGEDAFRDTAADVDQPGYYGRVLKVFREATGRGDAVGHLVNREALRDPLVARQYVQCGFASDGISAGTFGIYNLSVVTCNDRRPREGNPCDNLPNLRWERIRDQARDAIGVLARVADSPELSLPRVFSDVSFHKTPSWKDERSGGDFVSLQMTGSLSEDRPAREAVLALAPDKAGSFWDAARGAAIVPGFERFAVAWVNANGNYELVGVRKDPLFTKVKALAVVLDSVGQVNAISNAETMNATYRVNLFPANGYVVGYPFSPGGFDGLITVMDASSNSAYQPSRTVSAAVEGFAFVYVHRNDPQRRIKIFCANGPVMLGDSISRSSGTGYALAGLADRLAPIDQRSARDLWELNETRLGTLRSKKVSDVALEVLHSRSRSLLTRAAGTSDRALQMAELAQSLSLSRHIYQPLRGVMDDLVKAIVMLLLLSVPFAFAVERLVLCATSVYLRIAGFAGFFLLTFGLLYCLHPGFSIAATPMIVFLAFAIILLSGMVINIMTRKFRTELMVFQGRSNKVHNVEISRMGTLMTAVNMGMSTMRRRPVRTALTVVTAVMLTFTILCFASFTTSFGVRSFYTGPAAENATATFLTRNVNYDGLSADLLGMMRERAGENSSCCGLWWGNNRWAKARYAIARLDNSQSTVLDGMLGVSADEPRRWPALAAAIGLRGGADIPARGVLLPAIVERQLELSTGDSIIVNGEHAVYAGTFDESALQRLKGIDGQSILPVNFQDPSYDTTSGRAKGTDVVASDKAKVQRDFTRLSAGQICVASDVFVRRLGGQLTIVATYAGAGVDPEDEGRRIAEITALPVWVRTASGVERMVLTNLLEVSGGLALFVPLLLGGLIIFGTLLGSIADRQREIYTFSALGLGPAHVGFLFVAEAGVYAVVGGMGGELLAQVFAYVASFLAARGLILQPSINFSSTHSLFAIGVVMLTILLSAIYPAVKASASANPGIARTWKMPAAEGDVLALTFPFTVSAYDMSGVVSFLSEHFRHHEDAGLGTFAAQNVHLSRTPEGKVRLQAQVSLAPFDLGISQDLSLTAVASEIPGVDEVKVEMVRRSGTGGDWHRANRTFVHELRRQFLLWRTLSNEYIEGYRMQTAVEIGEVSAVAAGTTAEGLA